MLGLAVLSALYFSQARDVKRLREWAGRAPERDAEARARVAAATRPGRPARARPPPPLRPRPSSPRTRAPATPAAPPANSGAAAPAAEPATAKPATAQPATSQPATAPAGHGQLQAATDEERHRHARQDAGAHGGRCRRREARRLHCRSRTPTRPTPAT